MHKRNNLVPTLSSWNIFLSILGEMVLVLVKLICDSWGFCWSFFFSSSKLILISSRAFYSPSGRRWSLWKLGQSQIRLKMMGTMSGNNQILIKLNFISQLLLWSILLFLLVFLVEWSRFCIKNHHYKLVFYSMIPDSRCWSDLTQVRRKWTG